MGKLMGSYTSDELDRPDLNKCPDCGCFFATDECPLCGKACPEEMRAGNRKKVKRQKVRNANAGRVTFIPWYHTWTAIIITLICQPIIGVILLLTSPHSKRSKVIIVTVGVVWLFMSFAGFGLIGRIFNALEQPVDRSIPREEYMSICQDISAEELYRSADDMIGDFVTLELTVEDIYDQSDLYSGKKYPIYYVCSDESGEHFLVLVRDCRIESSPYIAKGDRITVYGECTGIDAYVYELPCAGLNAAYIEIE